MPKKSARVDAFVDESIRGQTYYLCAVLIPYENQALLRRQLRTISNLTNRRRIHFHSSSNRIRDLVIRTLASTFTTVVVVGTQVTHGIAEEDARQISMRLLVKSLQEMNIQRLTIENRSDNTQDYLTIQKSRKGGPPLDFWHISPSDEELLWAGDAIAWAVGAGSLWINKLNSFHIKFINGVQ
jgi:hypothetical protein